MKLAELVLIDKRFELVLEPAKGWVSPAKLVLRGGDNSQLIHLHVYFQGPWVLFLVDDVLNFRQKAIETFIQLLSFSLLRLFKGLMLLLRTKKKHRQSLCTA